MSFTYENFLYQVQKEEKDFLTHLVIATENYSQLESKEDYIKNWINFIFSKMTINNENIKAILITKSNEVSSDVRFDIIIDEKSQNFIFKKNKFDNIFSEFLENNNIIDINKDNIYDDKSIELDYPPQELKEEVEEEEEDEDEDEEDEVEDEYEEEEEKVEDEEEEAIDVELGYRTSVSLIKSSYEKYKLYEKIIENIQDNDQIMIYKKKMANHILRSIKHLNKLSYNYRVIRAYSYDESHRDDFGGDGCTYNYEILIKIRSDKGLEGEYFRKRLEDSRDTVFDEYKMYIKGIEDEDLVKNIFEYLCELFKFRFEVRFDYKKMIFFILRILNVKCLAYTIIFFPKSN